jgi:hypothetical protein
LFARLDYFQAVILRDPDGPDRTGRSGICVRCAICQTAFPPVHSKFNVGKTIGKNRAIKFSQTCFQTVTIGQKDKSKAAANPSSKGIVFPNHPSCSFAADGIFVHGKNLTVNFFTANGLFAQTMYILRNSLLLRKPDPPCRINPKSRWRCPTRNPGELPASSTASTIMPAGTNGF